MTAQNPANPPGSRAFTIDLTRDLPGSPSAVFRRWTEADALARWFAPPGYSTLSAVSNPRPGGSWRLEFESDDGRHRYREQGTFREVEPFARLVMTLTQIDGNHANPETLITLTLEDLGTERAPRTRMRFSQSGYQSLSLRNDNEEGWLGCFQSLADDLEPSGDGSPAAPR